MAGSQNTGLAEEELRDSHELLIQSVREAGALALTYFRANPKSWEKRAGDPVSEADIAVNDLLRERLDHPRPAYGWLSEESEDDPARLDADTVWIVDPIDGTSAFLDGQAEFTVAVALANRGEPVAAAVFNPATEEFWEALKGGGCRLNDAPVRVTDHTTCAGAKLLLRRRALTRSRDPSIFTDIETADPRSIAYRLALVAGGRFDAVVSLNGKCDWDLAAADLLVTEAGGLVSKSNGERFLYNQETIRHHTCIAANPTLHAALCDAFVGAG
ncbi:MAG: 3'(2'),5'-bisphosphate nucleotidase CysQ [Proteobacteria bacterium]|nr:3'(2'),5'-bisphosphate nucleotidase CysQ [Pseudomonadota bacterium]